MTHKRLKGKGESSFESNFVILRGKVSVTKAKRDNLSRSKRKREGEGRQEEKYKKELFWGRCHQNRLRFHKPEQKLAKTREKKQ